MVAECNLPEEIIRSVLRTTSEDLVRCFTQSVAMSKLDGMTGYNINVANAVAAIFAATGQDLGSIHESACGILNVEKTTEGLYLSLNLPGLVIGTVGGGTHLPKQKEALELMGCYGQGKVAQVCQHNSRICAGAGDLYVCRHCKRTICQSPRKTRPEQTGKLAAARRTE